MELPESAVFPSLIPAAPSTARKSRVTGMLLGEPAPRFVRRGRNVRYRLSDVLAWLSKVDSQRSTAEAFLQRKN
ncbi:DNA-binding protein [Vreelandella populi]|nr:DNA-binding protein [Halomonas populi]